MVLTFLHNSRNITSPPGIDILDDSVSELYGSGASSWCRPCKVQRRADVHSLGVVVSDANRRGSAATQASHLQLCAVDHYGVNAGRITEGSNHGVLHLSAALNEEATKGYVRTLNHRAKSDCEYACVHVTFMGG